MGGFVKDFCSRTSYASMADIVMHDKIIHPFGVSGSASTSEDLRRIKDCEKRFDKRLESFRNDDLEDDGTIVDA